MSSQSLIQSSSYVLLNGIQLKGSTICLGPFGTWSLSQMTEFKESEYLTPFHVERRTLALYWE